MPTVLHAVNSRRWSFYLQGIDGSEIIETVHARHAPRISATAGLSQL
jgi:hypothetical protein